MEFSLCSWLSTHPQALYCGEICIWGTRCDSVGGNNAFSWGEKAAKSQISVWLQSTCIIHASIISYIHDESDLKLTCSCEAPHQSMGQLACSYETHTHSTCVGKLQL